MHGDERNVSRADYPDLVRAARGAVIDADVGNLWRSKRGSKRHGEVASRIRRERLAAFIRQFEIATVDAGHFDLRKSQA